MTHPTEIASFDHAFVATESLLRGTADVASATSAEELRARLRSGDRNARATALARALAPIAVALERRRP